MTLPTTLYIHIPWCIQKCPYCDFNSHRSPDILPETAYVSKLLADLEHDISLFGTRTIEAIFIGGGTPSLLSGDAINQLLQGIESQLPINNNAEITMEANPGTAEQNRFHAYRQAGVNRLSLGIQSFDQQQLKNLGRIHNEQDSRQAIEMAVHAGFNNINLDIMHGLPRQTFDQGMADLIEAIDHKPNHISWYQLTLEPNTVFYKKPPKLPSEEICADLEEAGFALLEQHGYQRYEISAFANHGQQSRHNLNYWTFGDYFGIGAGAHGKLTMADKTTIVRTQKKRQPRDYLTASLQELSRHQPIDQANQLFEFMLNTSRLQQRIDFDLLSKRTNLDFDYLKDKLSVAANKGYITLLDNAWQVTGLGRRFTNDLQALFLPA